MDTLQAARVVVVGSGIAGSSIAYHLAKLGWRDIVVLEQGGAIHGTTSHAPGLIGQVRGSVALTRILMRSVALYRTLSLDGLDGYLPVGSLRLACSPDRLLEIKRQEGFCRTVGLDAALLSPAETLAACPLLDPDGVLGSLWVPGDGAARAKVLAGALMQAACADGAAVLRTHTTVTGVEVVDGRVRSVETSAGRIPTELLVVAAGIWTPEIGRMAGVAIPLVPFQHQYVQTPPVPGVDAHVPIPNVRDPDGLVYYRQEGDALVVGGYERNPETWAGPAPTTGADPTVRGFDPPRFAPLWEAMKARIPALRGMMPVKQVNGLESFTPDGEFVLGPAPEVGGFWVACGFNAHGMSGGGGVGEVLANWLATGDPGYDVWHMDLKRFGGHGASRKWVEGRAREVYATYYDVVFPGRERTSERGMRVGPVYHRLAALGAAFGEKAGWERPNWFTPNAERAGDVVAPRGWPAHNWSQAIAAEHAACRERVALFDESSFAKFEIEGADALTFLQRVAGNDLDKPVGAIVYTQLLDARGGIQADLTITRLAAERFFLVTGTAFGGHDGAFLREHVGASERVAVRDVTSGWCTLGLWGPRARDVLAAATGDDVSNEGFPYLTARAITVGAIPVRALRVTYVGELGWELYAPTEYAQALWDALWAAGQPHGMAAAGYRAIDSLRLEKGYRAWGSDLTPEDDPYQAGLGFAVRLGKGEFLAREALVARKAVGPDRRLVCVLLDDHTAWVTGGEALLVAGETVGRVTSGGYGYTVARSLAFGWLPTALAVLGQRVEVLWFGERIGAMVTAEPLYDPKNLTIKA